MAVVEVTEEMVERAVAEIDWVRIEALMDAEIERLVADDPDAAPIMTEAEILAVRVKAVHAKRGLP